MLVSFANWVLFKGWGWRNCQRQVPGSAHSSSVRFLDEKFRRTRFNARTNQILGSRRPKGKVRVQVTRCKEERRYRCRQSHCHCISRAPDTLDGRKQSYRATASLNNRKSQVGVPKLAIGKNQAECHSLSAPETRRFEKFRPKQERRHRYHRSLADQRVKPRKESQPRFPIFPPNIDRTDLFTRGCLYLKVRERRRWGSLTRRKRHSDWKCEKSFH